MSGQDRDNLRIASQLLKDAGFVLKDKQLVHKGTGIPLQFEVLLSSDTSVPHTQALVRGVERLGGKVTIRVVDSAQYVERLRKYDFDMIVHVVAQSTSPGNEQREYWGSNSADIEGGRNIFGFKSKAVDEMVEQLITAKSSEDLANHVKALDRVLQWNFLMIPQFYSNKDRVAWWNRLDMPKVIPSNGVDTMLWWVKK